MQEGRAFEQRLRIIIEQKLCKKKFQLIADSDDVSVVPAAAVAVIATTADAEVKKVKKTKKMVEEEQRKKEEEDETALEEIELTSARSRPVCVARRPRPTVDFCGLDRSRSILLRRLPGLLM